MPEEEFQALLQFFKVLADENRLKLLGLLATREYSVEELAATLQLKAPTISHHLARLKELGLVGMRAEGNTHMYWLNVDSLRTINKELSSSLSSEKMASLVDDIEGEAWERKVLKDFFEGERLKEIPASRKKRSVVLKWLAGQFEMDTRYTEPQVNEIIKRYHPDSAYFRRELIGEKLMQRAPGLYWRISTDSSDREDHVAWLRSLARRFEYGRSYEESEVDEILQRGNEGVSGVFLRHELAAENLLNIESGLYWRK
ncbi:MAG: metalloregulator ArsR/SmtB family transcription factor [Ktedonobacteraceae bacterium]